MRYEKEDLKRKNFSPDEFFSSNTAKELLIDNYPLEGNEQLILANLMQTADMMQEIRNLLDFPIYITSAYRCEKLNQLVGGSKNSQHTEGLACDFICKKFGNPDKIIKFLFERNFIADQCLMEGNWLHISRKKNDNRMMYGYYLSDEFGNMNFKLLKK